MSALLSPKKLHKINRIDHAVRDYFIQHPSVNQVAAKQLMSLFVERAVFFKNERRGIAIGKLLRQLHQEDNLHLLRHCKVQRNPEKVWYFLRS